MSSPGIILLLNIFPALLPPINEHDRDFYEVLGLSSRSASEQDIRKAYKTKSLSLHPDKIAQRRASAVTAEEAAKEYQLVQEAHSCLSDKAQRQKYNAVKCSPTRYRFLTQGGGLSNQMALLKKLHQASFADKTKLVIFVSIFPLLLLVQPILVAVKVNHVLAQENDGLEDAPWMAVLVPWWIFHGLYVVFWFSVSVMAPPEAKVPMLLSAVEQLLWLVSLILLALRWDQTISADYAVIFIPVYLALLLKWIQYVITMQAITADLNKMMSKDKFMKDVLKGREPEELDEAELQEIQSKHVVVTQIPDDVQHDLETDEDAKNLSEEEKEDIRVTSSREYEAAVEAYHDARRDMFKSMILHVTFLILLILKVDDHNDMTWWVVFCPILVLYGIRILSNCYVSCCHGRGAIDAEDMAIMAGVHNGMAATTGAADEEGERGVGEEEQNSNNEPAADGSFPLESEVLLHGLKTAEYNGKIGIIKGPLKDGRQEVCIKDLDKMAALKVINMKSPKPDEKKFKASTASNATSKEETKSDEAEPPATVAKEEKSAKAKNDSKKDKAAKASSGTLADANDSKRKKEKPEGSGENTDNDVDYADDNNDDDDDGIHIHIDEDAYRAYHSAYSQAEQNAMEERVKASQNNCIAIGCLIMICLLVAKLEQAYDAEEDREQNGDDADVDFGFNTLWLIFPLFLLAGCMVSCCACLIYNAPDPDELMEKHEGEHDGDEESGEGSANQGGDGDADTPIVFAPPPPPPPPPTEAAAADEKKETEKGETKEEENVTPPEVESDMHDVD